MCWPGCRGACWSGGGPGFRAPLKPGDRWPGWRLPRLARSACSSRAGRPVAGLVRCSEGARAPARESAPLTPPTHSLPGCAEPPCLVRLRPGPWWRRRGSLVGPRSPSVLVGKQSFLPSFLPWPSPGVCVRRVALPVVGRLEGTWLERESETKSRGRPDVPWSSGTGREGLWLGVPDGPPSRGPPREHADPSRSRATVIFGRDESSLDREIGADTLSLGGFPPQGTGWLLPLPGCVPGAGPVLRTRPRASAA